MSLPDTDTFFTSGDFTIDAAGIIFGHGLGIWIFSQGGSTASWAGKRIPEEGESVKVGDRVKVYKATVRFTAL